MSVNILFELFDDCRRLNMKDQLDATKNLSPEKFTTDACGEEHTTTIFGEECSALPPGQRKTEGGPFGAY